MKYLILWVLFCLAVISSCKSESNPIDGKDKKVPATLIGTTWDVTSFGIVDSTRTEPGSVGIFIEFYMDSSISGRSYQKGDGLKAGNSFAGDYVVNENQLSIMINGTTKINEPEGSRYLEFLSIINGNLLYEIRENRLHLESTGNDSIHLDSRN